MRSLILKTIKIFSLLILVACSRDNVRLVDEFKAQEEQKRQELQSQEEQKKAEEAERAKQAQEEIEAKKKELQANIKNKSISVTIQGLRNSEGRVVVVLCAQEDCLRGADFVQKETYPAEEGQMTIEMIPRLEPGEYVIFGFHDENGNDDWDHIDLKPLEAPIMLSSYQPQEKLPEFSDLSFEWQQKHLEISLTAHYLDDLIEGKVKNEAEEDIQDGQAEKDENEKSVLSVKIIGVKSSQGKIVLDLCDSDECLDDKSEPLKTVEVPAQEGVMDIQVPVPATGEYALTGFHDMNGDGRIEMNGAIPKEPVILPADVTLKPGLKFKDFKFDLSEKSNLELKVYSF